MNDYTGQDLIKEKHGKASRRKWVLLGSLTIIAFYLIAEHRVHLLGYLQYLPFLIFIGLHLFMHSRHGHGSHESQHGRDHQTEEPPSNKQL